MSRALYPSRPDRLKSSERLQLCSAHEQRTTRSRRSARRPRPAPGTRRPCRTTHTVIPTGRRPGRRDLRPGADRRAARSAPGRRGQAGKGAVDGRSQAGFPCPVPRSARPCRDLIEGDHGRGTRTARPRAGATPPGGRPCRAARRRPRPSTRTYVPFEHSTSNSMNLAALKRRRARDGTARSARGPCSRSRRARASP